MKIEIINLIDEKIVNIMSFLKADGLILDKMVSGELSKNEDVMMVLSLNLDCVMGQLKEIRDTIINKGEK